ncbi:MAG: hypothetical protein R2880_21825 [Deinococcales bacterium]
MSRLVLDLPKSLYEELDLEAQHEGISLDQYVLYQLSKRHVNLKRLVSPEKILADAKAYQAFIDEGPSANNEEITEFFNDLETSDTPDPLSEEQKALFSKHYLS